MRNSLFLILIFFCVEFSVAQITNDICADAIDITLPVEGVSAYYPVDFSCAKPSNNGDLQCLTRDFWTHGPDVWFTFVATNTSITVKTDIGSDNYFVNTAEYIPFALFTGPCDQLISEACREYTAFREAFYTLEIGQRYYLRFMESIPNFNTFYESLPDPGILYIESSDMGVYNDECIGATPLALGVDCVSGIGSSATASEEEAYSCANNNFYGDLWYSFVAPVSGSVSFDGFLSGTLYSGTCGSLSFEDCITSSSLDNSVIDLISGETYYFRLLAHPDSDFCIDELGDSVLPDNVLCTSSSSLTAGVSQEVDYGDLNSSEYLDCQEEPIYLKRSYYDFEATSESVLVTLENEDGYNIDCTAKIYNGSCTSLELYECYYWNGSSTVFDINNLVVGETYYLELLSRVDMNIMYEEYEYPCADDDHLVIPVNTTCNFQQFDLEGPQHLTSCSNGVEYYVTFIAPNSGAVEIQFDSGLYSSVTVRDVICDDSSILYSGFVRDEMHLSGLIEGQEYELVIGFAFADEICIQEVSFLHQDNDICNNAELIDLDTPFTFVRSSAQPESNNGLDSDCDVFPDLWFSFVATEEFVRVETDEVSSVSIYSGMCGSLTLLNGGEVEDDFFYTDLTMGETYFVRLLEDEINFDYTDRTVTLSTDNPPTINSDCNSAINMNDVSTSHNIATSLLALSNYDVPECISDGDDIVDAWYVFTADSESIEFITSSSFEFVLYTNDCSNLVLDRCFSERSFSRTRVNNLIVGIDYYVRIFAPQSVPNLYFNISTYDSQPFDSCENASPINTDEDYYRSHYIKDANTGVYPFNDGVCHVDNSSWYTFVGPTAGAIRIKVDGDCKIGLYASDCNALSSIGCMTMSDRVESDLISVIPGEIYYLQVAHVEPNYRPLSFSIKSVSPVIDDDCDSAITISNSIDSNCDGLLSSSSVDRGDTFGAFCGQSIVAASFFSFTPDESATYQITIDNAAASHSVTLFSDCTLASPIACGVSALDMALIQDQNYIVAVYPTNAEVKSSFDICIHTPEVNEFGNVGVGTTNPQSTLDVNGGVKLGNTTNEILGVVRWNNDVEVYTGSEWKSLSKWDQIATADIDMQAFRLTDVAAPINDTDAATKSYVDANVGADLSALNELQTISKSGSIVTLSDSGGSFEDAVDDADSDPTNEIETWSTLAGIPIEISDGDDVDDADSDPTNEIETWSTLAGIPIEISDGDDVDDADNDPTNEIETWSTLAGIPIEISDGDDVDDADSDPTNEIETWSTLAGIPVDISDGDDVNDADSDPTNEIISSITLVNEELTITENASAEMIDLSPIATQWDDDGADIYVIGTSVGVGTDDPEELIDARGTIQSKMNSGSGNPQLNLVESNTGAARLYLDNSINDPIALLGQPSSNPDNAKFTIFVEGDVVSVTGEQRVGINNTSPDHPLEVGTNSGNGNGAHLTAGGTWTNMSSRTLKENFQSVNSREILTKLAALNILKWDYKQSEEGTHLGPIAEEFYEAFGLGSSDMSISTVDADGVALAAIKALHEENIELQKEMKELKKLVIKLLNQK